MLCNIPLKSKCGEVSAAFQMVVDCSISPTSKVLLFTNGNKADVFAPVCPGFGACQLLTSWSFMAEIAWPLADDSHYQDLGRQNPLPLCGHPCSF